MAESKTTSVNVSVKYLRPKYKNLNEWRLDPNNVYCGRSVSYSHVQAPASKWANPYPLSRYTIERSLELYEQHIRATLYQSLDELRGKTLGCWCKPERCHTDVLIKLIEEKSNKLKS